MNNSLTDPFDLTQADFACEAPVRVQAKVRLGGDTEAAAKAAAPAPELPKLEGFSLKGLAAPSAHTVWLHVCVALTAIAIVWTTLFTPMTARSAAVDRMSVMLALSGGDLSDAGLRRYASHLDPAIVTLARRLTAERPHNPFARGLMQAAASAAEPADRQGASFRYQDFTAEQARIWNALVPVSKAANPPAQPFVLKSDDIVNYSRAVNCLTAAVYYEAASESQTGQQAVAQVVLNRMRHPTFPKTVCGVVFEGSQLSTGCQFSFACDGSLARRPSIEGWARARAVAVAALNGFVAKSVGQATHYHAVYVAPYWSPTLLKVQNIGAHIFYRWMGGSGLPGAFHGAYGGTEPYIAKLAALDTAFVGTMSDVAPAPVLAVAQLSEPATAADTLGLRPAEPGVAETAATAEAPVIPVVIEAAPKLPEIKAPALTPTPERAPQRRRHIATPQGW